jgi:hypothetical protein
VSDVSADIDLADDDAADDGERSILVPVSIGSIAF